MAESKNQTIQIMRGIAIAIVLLRHAIAQVNRDAVLDVAEQIIICFHMPVFFVVSGYLFQKQLKKYQSLTKAKFLAGKAKRLLVPYAFWTVLLWTGVQIACKLSPAILAKMTEIGFAPMSVGNLLYGLLTYQVYYTEHLWFVYVLFLLFVINIFMQRVGATRYTFVFWLIIGLVTLFVDLPHIIERTLLWGVFFEFGRITYKYSIPAKCTGGGNLAACILFIGGSVLRIAGQHSEITGRLFGVLMQLNKYLIGFAGVVLIYAASRYLSRFGKALKVPKTVGDYSFDIYLMHNPYFVALSAIALNKLLGVNSYVTVIIATLLGICIPMLVSYLVIRRVKWMSSIMIGR